ncbi:MAG: hypothetical protein HGA96_14045 [Desulfobulbaceae bacterium]|nr:hypothetical protein [Desulfobulbaceae bacterium]
MKMKVLLLNKNYLNIVIMLLLCACSSKEPPTVLKQGGLPEDGNICRVAVLPFVNQTNYLQADDLFSRVFVSELVNSGNYQVAQEGDVRKFLQQMQVLPNQPPDIEQLRAMADRFGAQVVISGTVTEMSDKSEYGISQTPSLAVVVRIIEGDSGRTLWSTYTRREGFQYRKIMHFGLVNSVTSLAKFVSAEIVEAWNEEGFKKCTEQ